MNVKCELCGKEFTLMSPEGIIEVRTMDDMGNEVAPRRDIFACATCINRYVIYIEQEEDE